MQIRSRSAASLQINKLTHAWLTFLRTVDVLVSAQTMSNNHTATVKQAAMTDQVRPSLPKINLEAEFKFAINPARAHWLDRKAKQKWESNPQPLCSEPLLLSTCVSILFCHMWWRWCLGKFCYFYVNAFINIPKLRHTVLVRALKVGLHVFIWPDEWWSYHG